jgi:hypothetical protein
LSGCSRIRLPALGLFEPTPAQFGAELRTVICVSSSVFSFQLSVFSFQLSGSHPDFVVPKP